jgi:hypothetical protein
VNVSGNELRAGMRFEALFGGLNFARININSVVVNKFQEYFRGVAIRAAEVQQPARWLEDRSVQISLEIGTAQNVLNQVPQRLPYRDFPRTWSAWTSRIRPHGLRFSLNPMQTRLPAGRDTSIFPIRYTCAKLRRGPFRRFGSGKSFIQ